MKFPIPQKRFFYIPSGEVLLAFSLEDGFDDFSLFSFGIQSDALFGCILLQIFDRHGIEFSFAVFCDCRSFCGTFGCCFCSFFSGGFFSFLVSFSLLGSAVNECGSLLAEDGVDEHAYTVFIFNDLHDIVRVCVELMSHAVNFHGQIFIGDLEVFLVSDCFEDETLSYLFSSSSFVVSTELCFCLVHSLEVVIKRHVLAFEVHLDFFNDLVDALINHFMRDIYFSVCDSLVYQCVVVSFFSLLESLQLHLLLQACLQLVDGFELADGFSEFVIDFRQLFALYIIDMNFKFSFLALQSIYEVVCRECNLDIYIVACLVAFELVFKTWNEALGTDFQRIGLARTAPSSAFSSLALCSAPRFSCSMTSSSEISG